MKIDDSNISIKDVLTPANYAITKGFTRQYVYKMMDNDLIDYVLIDGIKFVFMNSKAKHYLNNRTNKQK